MAGEGLLPPGSRSGDGGDAPCGGGGGERGRSLPAGGEKVSKAEVRSSVSAGGGMGERQGGARTLHLFLICARARRASRREPRCRPKTSQTALSGVVGEPVPLSPAPVARRQRGSGPGEQRAGWAPLRPRSALPAGTAPTPRGGSAIPERSAVLGFTHFFIYFLAI